MPTQASRRCFVTGAVVFCFFLLFFPCSLPAATNFWLNSTGDAQWTNTANWTPAADPRAQDLVFSTNGAAPTNNVITGIVPVNLTINSLSFTNLDTGSPALWQHTWIEAGATLQITGNVANVLLVGAQASNLNVNTHVTFSGPGGLAVVRSNRTIQIGNSIPTNAGNSATLDMQGLGSFTADVGDLRIGDNGGNTGVGGGCTVYLATNSVVVASNIWLKTGRPNAQSLFLGAGTNLIQANNIYANHTGRSGALLRFATNTGSVTVRARNGIGRANLFINYEDGFATGANTSCTNDFSGHYADLWLDQVVVARRNKTSGTGGSAWMGALAFDQGILNANQLVIARKWGQAVSNSTSVRGTVNLGGGTVTIGSGGIIMADNFTTTPYSNMQAIAALNIAGATVSVGASNGVSIQMAKTATNGNGLAVATIALTNGILTVAGDILGATNGVTNTIILAGGTLDMQGHSLGSTSAPIDVLTIQSGTLRNVGGINGNGGFIKPNSTTVNLEGTNAFTGPVEIQGGTLQFNGQAVSSAMNIYSGASLIGQGTVLGSINNLFGGTLAPGPGLVTLTVMGNLSLVDGSLTVMKLSGVSSTCDQLQVMGSFIAGGNLLVTNLEVQEPAAGSSFRLFPAIPPAGAFSNIQLPPLTGGKTWDTNSLYTTGTLAIQGAPEAVINPQSQSTVAGSTVSFLFLAQGIPAPEYQWFFNGNSLPGQTSSNLVMVNVQATNAGNYFATASNVVGTITSTVVSLVLTNPNQPVFIIQPTNTLAWREQSATLVSLAIGAGDIRYQWFFAGTLLNDATNPVLTVTGLSCAQAGLYQVTAANASGTTPSHPAWLTVNETNPPQVLTVPTHLVVPVGGSAGVTAEIASNCNTAAFAWYRDTNTLLNGVSGLALNLSNVQFSDAGWYSVVVSNLGGSVTSAVLQLQVYATAPTGSGLTAEYFDNNDFTTLKLTRVDPFVDFHWGSSSPASGVSANTYSVRWSGSLKPRYSESYTFYVTADDGARLWVDDRLIAARTFYSPASAELRGKVNLQAGQPVNLRLEYLQSTNRAQVRLEWASASQPREVIPQSVLYPSTLESDRGSILEEHWLDIPGTEITNLTASTNYPYQPDGREYLISFESLQPNWADNYGTRASGYIVAPTDGFYTFAVAGADAVQLYLSPDTNAANKQLIASVTNATAWHEWSNHTGQISTPRALISGQRYYVELLHKAGTNADHFSVSWLTPGNAAFSVIGAESLIQAGLERTIPAQTNLLNTLTRNHPRLLVTRERFEWLKQQIITNSTGNPAKWYISNSNSARGILTNTTITYSPDVRGTILDESRTLIDRMYKLALVYRISGDTNYAERAWTELNAAGNFPDWHPPHFLDTAEMTHGFAIAYDWLYDYWTAARLQFIRTNIISKGLNAGLTEYSNNAWWSLNTANNWNCVCNGGLTLGALAVGADGEVAAEQMLAKTIPSSFAILNHFLTDNGAWYEGPGYWDYTTSYNSRMLAGLESALGSDFGLSHTNMVSESGMFAILQTSANKRNFNFADAGVGSIKGVQMLWYARRFNRPEYAWHQRTYGGGNVLDALLYDARGQNPQASGISPDTYWHGPTGVTPFQPQEVFVLRSRWNDTNETFLAFKGGEVGASHGHLDAGTFVLDALGKRWVPDLGGDDYALPNYFGTTPIAGADRWDYYRCRAEGHNTIVLNPNLNPDQKLGAVAKGVLFASSADGDGSLGIVDLSPAYTNATRVWRGFKIFNQRNDILIQDEIQSALNPTNCWWFMHVATNTTQVQIDPDGTAAMLTQGTNRLWVKLVTSNGVFSLRSATPLPTSTQDTNQDPNTAYAKLAIQLTNVANATYTVWMKPLLPSDTPPTVMPDIVPLTKWNLNANQPPMALTSFQQTVEDNSLDVDLRTLVSDPETQIAQLNFTLNGSSNGTVTLLPDGYTARFTPATNFSGTATFNYTVADQGLDSRLLAFYSFVPPDYAADGYATDFSGKGRDGVLNAIGSPSSLFYDSSLVPPLPWMSATSLRLNQTGTNGGRVLCSLDTNDYNLSDADWTVSLWFCRGTQTNDDFLFYIGTEDGYGGGSDELSLFCPPNNPQVQALHFDSRGTNDMALSSSFTVNTGEWHHVALVFQRMDTNTGQVRLYLDGTLSGSSTNLTWALKQSTPLIFGGHAITNSNVNRWFNGWMAELSLFSAALTDAEIARLATQAAAQFGSISVTNSLQIAVTPINDPPLTLIGNTNGPRNNAIDVDLTLLGTDVETPVSNLIYKVFTPTNGTVTLLADGHTARFTPATNYFGNASFGYSVKDIGTDPRVFLNYTFNPPDTTSDALASDVSNNAHDGTLLAMGNGAYAYTNLVPSALTNRLFASLTLTQPGTNGAARLTRLVNTNELNLSDQSWTASFWLQRLGSTNDDIFFYLGTDNGFGGGGDELQFYCPSGQSSVRLIHYNATNFADIDMTSGTTVGTGQWHHVAITFERTNVNAGWVRTYLDGAQFGRTTNVQWSLPQQGKPLVFGAHGTTSGYYDRCFNGRMADIALFTTNLSLLEILSFTNTTVGYFGGLTSTNQVFLTITIGSNAPTVTLISPANYASLAAGNVSLSATASDLDNNLDRVEFFANDEKIGQKTNAPYSITWTNPAPGYYRLFARATDSTGLSSQSFTNFVSIRWPLATVSTNGSYWKYHDLGQNLGTTWQLPTYDDSTWPGGQAPFGYGVTNGSLIRTTNSYGPDVNSKYIATYYRRTFIMPDRPAWSNALLSVQRDDGAIVFLNGMEVFRSNLKTGAVDYLTLATTNVPSPAETNWWTTNIPASLFVPGTNLLAVEIHQFTNNSPDLWFDLKLIAEPIPSAPHIEVTITATNQNLAFQWPDWASGLQVQYSTNLFPTALWFPLTNATTTNGFGYRVMTLPTDTNKRFYRLISP